METISIFAHRLLTPAGWRGEHSITVGGGRILDVRPGQGEAADREAAVVAPGYLDLHNHGGEGFEPASCSLELLQRYLNKLLSCGTTGLLLTVSTGDPEAIRRAMGFVRQAMELQEAGALGGSRILGVHMEGPFLNPARSGAMNKAYILRPDAAAFERLFGGYTDIVRLVTLAPEEPGARELTAWLVKRGIRVQAGHTDSGFEQAEEAFAFGVTSLCHTFNACRPIHHREPGIVAAALVSPSIYCEAICDLEHLAPGAIRLLHHCKGPDRMMLVTDSTMPTGLPDGEYQAGSHPVIVKDGVKRTPSGGLSGGICYLDQSVRNLIACGIPPADALTMASRTPANRMGWNQLGAVAPGQPVGLVGLDRNYSPLFAMVGERISSR